MSSLSLRYAWPLRPGGGTAEVTVVHRVERDERQAHEQEGPCRKDKPPRGPPATPGERARRAESDADPSSSRGSSRRGENPFDEIDLPSWVARDK